MVFLTFPPSDRLNVLLSRTAGPSIPNSLECTTCPLLKSTERVPGVMIAITGRNQMTAASPIAVGARFIALSDKKAMISVSDLQQFIYILNLDIMP